ncbi:MAG TPA: hypoxanthine phosphoribosyltransferase [Firmicutes bacterium]|nr:hypoxanthine phosphoribosyltransferase [Bacillota bacterium]
MKIGKILIQEDEIRRRVKELGEEISRDYQGKEPTLVSILKGGIIFLSDLVRALSILHEIDFMSVSSYDGGTESSGVVRILADLSINIEGRDVIIVEDIVDTGLTLDYIRHILLARHPKSLRICTLLDKKSRRRVEVPLDYVGFVIPDAFVIGYGLDYAEKYRNLPYIAILEPDR